MKTTQQLYGVLIRGQEAPWEFVKDGIRGGVALYARKSIARGYASKCVERGIPRKRIKVVPVTQTLEWEEP